MNRKQVYVFAGPNGAGKTTFTLRFLPVVKCRNFVNADMIAGGISPLDAEAASIKAGRILLERIQDLASLGKDFAFESTLSGLGHLRMLAGLRTRGYSLNIFFLWLPNSQMACDRVALRVRQGGHN